MGARLAGLLAGCSACCTEEYFLACTPPPKRWTLTRPPVAQVVVWITVLCTSASLAQPAAEDTAFLGSQTVCKMPPKLPTVLAHAPVPRMPAQAPPPDMDVHPHCTRRRT